LFNKKSNEVIIEVFLLKFIEHAKERQKNVLFPLNSQIVVKSSPRDNSQRQIVASK
jgi:hypothetical protein